MGKIDNRPPRFPGVNWYCDSCGANLNIQPGFDDHKYTWKCARCNRKNSISRDNIRDQRPGRFQGLSAGLLFYKRNGSGCSEQELDGRVLFRSLSGVIRFILYVIDV